MAAFCFKGTIDTFQCDPINIPLIWHNSFGKKKKKKKKRKEEGKIKVDEFGQTMSKAPLKSCS